MGQCRHYMDIHGASGFVGKCFRRRSRSKGKGLVSLFGVHNRSDWWQELMYRSTERANLSEGVNKGQQIRFLLEIQDLLQLLYRLLWKHVKKVL